MQLLAAPSMPDEVREEIEARALAGEKITVAEVQAVLEVLALGPASKREVADALGVRLDVVGRCIHELDLGKDSVRILTHR